MLSFQNYKARLFGQKSAGRRNVFLIALEHYPSGLFKTSIGITLLGAPFLLNYFSELGVESLVVRILLNGLAVVLFPATILLCYSLFRAPKLRRELEAFDLQQAKVAALQLAAVELQEEKDEYEITRLRDIVISEGEAREAKDTLEETRWDSLNERLRIQEQTGQLNTDLREQRDIARQDLESIERLDVAQKVKSIRDNEQLESGKRNDEQKIERNEERLELALTVLAAQEIKNKTDDERWNTLHERLRVQEALDEKRDLILHRREQYRTLLDRYIRHATLNEWSPDVGDGFAAIPRDWLIRQPEIIKDPSLMRWLTEQDGV